MKTVQNTFKSLRQAVNHELEMNLLPFWLTHVKDRENGFTSRMSNDLVKESTSKGLVFHARLLWTFSSLYRFKSDLKYLKLARECYVYIKAHFLDQEFGGAYWLLSTEGQPDDTKKKTYGQAFLIYALSEFYKCYPHSAIRNQAIELFMHLEQHAFDKNNLGYYEVCERNWTLAEDQRLSDKDMNECKSMNTHLHTLEAFTNLYSICEDNVLKYRLIMLLEIFREKIIQSDTGHFGLFFDDAWNVRSQGISFGHEIEASWLIHEAAKVLGDPEILTRYEYIAGKLAESVYSEGLGTGGLNYEIDGQGNLDTDKHFWVQAEGLVGFLNAWEITGQDEYRETVFSIWDFIQEFLADRKHGEWYWKVDSHGVPDDGYPKVSIWKSPYHNIRACLEVIKRIDALLSKHHYPNGSYIYGG